MFPTRMPFILNSVLALTVAANAADVTLAVSLSDSIRPATHCASGSLYGMTETLPSDIANLVAPLHPNSFNQPAMSGNGRQQPIGDALKISERLVGTTGKVQVRLADILPGWPYSWPGQASWLASVKALIQSKIASGRSNYDGYEIWNEPDGTWQSANGDFNTVLWKPTYDLIRSLDPSAKIIGPSYSWYNSSAMSSFLDYCKNNNVLPDVISWHQWGSEGFVGAYNNLRSLEVAKGISPRQISINEYSSGTHEYEGSPGVSVPFIAKFERNKVQSAMISWWFTGLPGRLGSLLTDKNAKGGGWWMYKWYGDMTGYMAKVTPPNDNSDGVDGFVSVDKSAQYASIVLGGKSIGNVNVNISGIPAWFGSSVNAKLEYVTWVNKDTEVTGTNQISNSQVTVNNGSISIPVNVTSQFYAYRIYLTPVTPASSSSSAIPSSSSVAVSQAAYSSASIPGTIQAENYDIGGEGVAYHDNDTGNSGNMYRTDGVDITGSDAIGYKLGWTVTSEWLKYTVTVATGGVYKWEASVSSGLDGSSFQVLLDNAPLIDSTVVPNTGSWDTYATVSGTTPNIAAGKHELKLVIDGSYCNIDWMKFSEQPVGIQSTGIIQKQGLYTIYSLTGKVIGELTVSSGANLNALVSKQVAKPGMYLVKSRTNTVAQKVYVTNSQLVH